MALNGTFAKKDWPWLFSGNDFSMQFQSETKSICVDYEYLSTLILEWVKSCISSPMNLNTEDEKLKTETRNSLTKEIGFIFSK